MRAGKAGLGSRSRNGFIGLVAASALAIAAAPGAAVASAPPNAITPAGVVGASVSTSGSTNFGTHGCAVRRNATLACWGRNGQGQASPPAGTFSQVSVTI